MDDLTPEGEIKKKLFEIRKLLKEATEIADQHGIVFAYKPPNTIDWGGDNGAMKYLPEQPVTNYDYWSHSSKECAHTLEGPSMWITAFADGFHSLKAVSIDAES